MSIQHRTALVIAATALMTALFATCGHADEHWTDPACFRPDFTRPAGCPSMRYSVGKPVPTPLPVTQPNPDTLPRLDPEAKCARAASSTAQQDTAVCIKAEQYAYDDLKALWPGLSPEGKRQCTPRAGVDNYGETYRWVLACTIGRLRGEENERNANGPKPQFERW